MQYGIENALRAQCFNFTSNQFLAKTQTKKTLEYSMYDFKLHTKVAQITQRYAHKPCLSTYYSMP